MKFSKTIISFLFFLLLYNYSKAQDTIQPRYVYEDSSAKPDQDSVVYAKPPDVAPPGDTTYNQNTSADTVLQLNNLLLSVDSVNKLKNSKSLIYTQTLDSVLKEWQRKNRVKIDTSARGPGILDAIFNSAITKVFLWSLAILFILFILYKLFFIEGGFKKAAVRNNVNILSEAEESATISNYDPIISKAINDKDYRVAVRYLFLQTLQKLSAKNLIQLAVDKTNYQYATEITNPVYKNNFLSLTRNYEYVWYGEFELEDDTFKRLQQKFNQFNSGI